eukprot:COSAG02_NODE_13855_length_1338_cov_1.344633_3_plen_102_part_01
MAQDVGGGAHLRLRSNLVIEEVTVQCGLEHAADDDDRVPVAAERNTQPTARLSEQGPEDGHHNGASWLSAPVSEFAVDPVDDVESTVGAEREDIVRVDVLAL